MHNELESSPNDVSAILDIARSKDGGSQAFAIDSCGFLVTASPLSAP